MNTKAKFSLLLAAFPLAGFFCDDPPASPVPVTPLAPDATTAVVPDAGEAFDSGEHADAEPKLEDAMTMVEEDAGTPMPARIFFLFPTNHARISATTDFMFGAENFRITPATRPAAPNEGHFHLFVDAPCAAPGDPINVMFDLYEGQEGERITLPIGPHTLCLQAGDSDHVALDLTESISVIVQ